MGGVQYKALKCTRFSKPRFLFVISESFCQGNIKMAYKIAPMLDPLGQCGVLSLINTDVAVLKTLLFFFLPDQIQGSDQICPLCTY